MYRSDLTLAGLQPSTRPDSSLAGRAGSWSSSTGCGPVKSGEKGPATHQWASRNGSRRPGASLAARA